jgi:hypothetical protein
MMGKAEGRRQKAEGAAARPPDPPVAKSGDIPLVKGDKREKEELAAQAARVHERLNERLGHCWRLETWTKKYEARLRVYGLEKCLAAVDGFCSVKWYVENQSNNAPDLIFRDDKHLEKFLALGMKLPEHSSAEREKRKQEAERASGMRETRNRLKWKTREQTARMHQKLAPLREEINTHSWEAFISPLLFVAYEKGVVIIFSEDAQWVEDHYLVAIERVIGCRVKIVDRV